MKTIEIKTDKDLRVTVMSKDEKEEMERLASKKLETFLNLRNKYAKYGLPEEKLEDLVKSCLDTPDDLKEAVVRHMVDGIESEIYIVTLEKNEEEDDFW